ncbi:general odorant-binding protein 57c-like [Musca vetustissima]|uniref:general odorant-binding protein 57c-like n=1 Tax=Musca vetustissima TaxID=27455 RepID=UPI002AB7AF8D|nr:general odorant-binding protein 57c-like [Musca vetustissima]
MNLTVIVLIVVVAVSVLEKSSADDLDDVRHVVCMEQSEIAEDEFDSMMDMLEANATDDMDHRFKCYTHCMLEKWDHFDETGKLDLAKMEDKNMSASEIEAVEKCKNDTEDIEDKCEYAFALTVCFREGNKMNYSEVEEDVNE